MLPSIRLLRLMPLVIASLLTCPARGQDGVESAPASQPAAAARHADAEKAFEPLKKEFANLFNSLRALNGYDESEKELIVSLRDRVASFSEEWPQYIPAAATELTLSMWLKEEGRIDHLFERLIALMPDEPEIRLEWAGYHRSLDHHGRVIEILGAQPFDYSKYPLAGLELASALFSEERFQEACDELAKVPEEAIKTHRHSNILSMMLTPLKPNCPKYVELWAKEQELRQAEANASADKLLPQVLILTSRGPITVELFENEAPNHVANFISLVETGFYTGTKFHRVEPALIQGGDPNTKAGGTGNPGEGGPGYRIAQEYLLPNHRMHFTGSLAMARKTEADSGGSQFYITRVPTPDYNDRYTVFGRVIDGLEVVRQMQKDDEILSATVLRKRDHEYEPQTLPDPTAPISLRPMKPTPATMPGDSSATAPAEGSPTTPPPGEQPATAPETAPQ
jgi:cyclophilin family peptidyl-prolyl cis-trans isomerase